MESTSRLETLPTTAATPLPDPELIARVRLRDEHALGTLYDRYHRLIYTIALRITGDRATSEEVVQDVFHAVWRSSAGFQPDRSVAAWLIGITRHRAIDATRTRAYRAYQHEVLLEERQLSRVEHIDDQAIAIVQHEAVRLALAVLAPAQRQAIMLAYYGGLTCREIALRLGEPEGTVKSQLRLGLAKLHAALQDVVE